MRTPLTHPAWDAPSPPKRVFYPKPGRIPKRGGSGTRICHPTPPAGVPSTPPAPLGSALPHAAAQHRGSRVLGTGAQRPLLSPALQRARSTRGRQAVTDRLPKSSEIPPKRSPGTPHHGQGSGTGAARRDPRPPPARALPVRAALDELEKSSEKPKSGIPKSCPPCAEPHTEGQGEGGAAHGTPTPSKLSFRAAGCRRSRGHAPRLPPEPHGTARGRSQPPKTGGANPTRSSPRSRLPRGGRKGLEGG